MGDKVYLGNDTAGYYLKSKCIEYLEGKGIPYVDCGSDDNPDIEATRYPFFAAKVANAVRSGEARCGVLICGTGIGISLAANKVPGIRAAVCSEPYSAEMTVRHNNAQIIAFGARVVGDELAKKILDAFFGAKFEGGRHAERVQKIIEIEKKYNK